MQLTENDESLLGIMTTILMLRKEGQPAYHVDEELCVLKALRVLAIIKNPGTGLEGRVTRELIIAKFDEVFPDPEEVKDTRRFVLRRDGSKKYIVSPETDDEIHEALLREP